MSKFERMHHKDWRWLSRAKHALLAHESMPAVAVQVLRKLPTHPFLLETHLKSWLKSSWSVVRSDYRVRYDLNPTGLLTLLVARVAYTLSAGDRELQYQLMFPSLRTFYDVMGTSVHELPLSGFILVDDDTAFLDMYAAFSAALQSDPGERGIRNFNPTHRPGGYRPYVPEQDMEKLRVHPFGVMVLEKIEKLESREQQAQGPHIAALIRLRQGLERGDEYNEGKSDSAGEPASLAILHFGEYLESLVTEERQKFLAWSCEGFSFKRGSTLVDVKDLGGYWDLLCQPADYSGPEVEVSYATCVNERWRSTLAKMIEVRTEEQGKGSDGESEFQSLLEDVESTLKEFKAATFSVAAEEEFLPAVIPIMHSASVGHRLGFLSAIYTLLPENGMLINIINGFLWQLVFDEDAFLGQVRESQNMRNTVPQDLYASRSVSADGKDDARDFVLLAQRGWRLTYPEFVSRTRTQGDYEVLLTNHYVLSHIKTVMYDAMLQVIYLLRKKISHSSKAVILKAVLDVFVDDELELFADVSVPTAWRRFIHVASFHQSSFYNNKPATSVVNFFKRTCARSHLLRWMFSTGRIQVWSGPEECCFSYADFCDLCEFYGVSTREAQADVVVDGDRPLFGVGESSATGGTSLLPTSLLMAGLGFTRREAEQLRRDHLAL